MKLDLIAFKDKISECRRPESIKQYIPKSKSLYSRILRITSVLYLVGQKSIK